MIAGCQNTFWWCGKQPFCGDQAALTSPPSANLLQSRRASRELEADRQRKDKKIRVVLSYGAKELELPVEMRRSEFTRAELLGRLGMIPMREKGKRFELTHLNTAEFLRWLNEISDGNDRTTPSLPCTQQEFEQFDIN